MVSPNVPWACAVSLQPPFTSFFPTTTEYHFSPLWSTCFEDRLVAVETYQPVENGNSPADVLETQSNPEEEIDSGQQPTNPFDQQNSLCGMSAQDQSGRKAQRLQHSI